MPKKVTPYSLFLPPLPKGLEIKILDESTMNYSVLNRYGEVKHLGRSYFIARWWAFLNPDMVSKGYDLSHLEIEDL